MDGPILEEFATIGEAPPRTANGYAKGHSEAILGEHLAHDRKKRDRVVLATKFTTNMFLGDPNGGGSNRKAVVGTMRGIAPSPAHRLHRPLDRTFDLLDLMDRIAAELGTTVPRVALAWVQGRPGVASTIIGARTLDQLDDNVGALGVKLTPAHVQALDQVTTPQLPFPTNMLAAVPTFAFGGTTINDQPSQRWTQAPQNDAERF